jgi:hypothetical protein
MTDLDLATADGQDRYVPSATRDITSAGHEGVYEWIAENLVTDGMRALDFGCGTGDGAALLARAGASSEVLEHVVDPFAFVRGMAESLNDGGAAFVGTPNRLWSIDHVPDGHLLARSHLMEFTPPALIALLRTVFDEVSLMVRVFPAGAMATEPPPVMPAEPLPARPSRSQLIRVPAALVRRVAPGAVERIKRAVEPEPPAAPAAPAPAAATKESGWPRTSCGRWPTTPAWTWIEPSASPRYAINLAGSVRRDDRGLGRADPSATRDREHRPKARVL